MPTILIKKSDTPGAAPTGSDLTNLAGGAEIAVNTADKRVFSMNSSSAIIELGTNPGSLTTADASATVLRAGSATITNLITAGGSVVLTTVSATSGTITNLTSTSGTVTQLFSTSATLTNVSSTSGTISTLTSTSASITNLTAGSLVLSNLSIASANITTLTGTTFGTTATTQLRGASGQITTLTATSANITTLTGTTLGTFTSGTVTNLNVTSANITTLTGTTFGTTATTQLRGASANITNLSGTSANITNIVSTSATLTNITSTSGTITTLVSTSATLTTIAGTSANITTITENASPVVVQTDIGTAPNEVPLNQYLGTMAFQDADAITVGQIAANGAVSLDNAVTINDSGADVDFRVEGDTDANLLFVDASTDRVGVGTNAPLAKFQVGDGTATTEIRIDADGGSGAGGFVRGYRDTTNAAWYIGDLNPIAGGTNDGMCAFTYGANPFIVFTNGVERLRVDSAGNLGLGVTPNSGWASDWKAFQLFGNGSLSGISGLNAVFLSSNVYRLNDQSSKYIASDLATQYQQYNGEHRWFTAPSGTANNTITFTQAMTLDASGNLGVGTSSPSQRLSVVSSGQVVGNFSHSSTSTDANNGGALIRIQNTSSTNNNMQSLLFANASGTGTSAIFGYNANQSTNEGFMTFGTRNSSGTFAERARITAGGFFKASDAGTYLSSGGTYHELRSTENGNYLGRLTHTSATDPYGINIYYTAASPNGTGNEFIVCEDSTALRAEIRSNGGLANYSANNVNLASDERLKKDIAPLDSTWSKVKDIEVVNFRYKDCNEGDPALYGVIAQQVQPIVPELVVVTREATETDPEYYGIREQPMYWLAIKALQEAMARIEQLEADVAALKGT